ncbi:MAG: PRC-barrel domain-containing protein [Longimicrobiales bacterium]
MADMYERIPLRPVQDLKGLSAADATGIPVGELYGALVEADTGLVRYLDLSLVEPQRHVLIPIGHARIVSVDVPHVKLRAALLEELQQIPPYGESDTVDDPYEDALLDAHGRIYHGERYYAHPGYEHRMLFAGEHPIIATQPVDADARPLQPLASLDGYRIAEDEPDIHGWRIRLDGDGTEGTVVDVVVDVHALKVRYLSMQLLGETSAERRTVLLPIGFLQLAADTATVHAPALTEQDVRGLPSYDGGAIERDDEDVIRRMLRESLKGNRRYHLPDYYPAV